MRDKKGKLNFDNLKVEDIKKIADQIPQHKKYIEEISHNAAGNNNPYTEASILSQLSASDIPTNILHNSQFRKDLTSGIINIYLQNNEISSEKLTKIVKTSLSKYASTTQNESLLDKQGTLDPTQITKKDLNAKIINELPLKTQNLLTKICNTMTAQISSTKDAIMSMINPRHKKAIITPEKKGKEKKPNKSKSKGGYSSF